VLDARPDVVLVSCAYDIIDADGNYLGTWKGDEPHEVISFILNFFNIVGGGGQVMFRLRGCSGGRRLCARVSVIRGLRPLGTSAAPRPHRDIAIRRDEKTLAFESVGRAVAFCEARFLDGHHAPAWVISVPIAAAGMPLEC